MPAGRPRFGPERGPRTVLLDDEDLFGGLLSEVDGRKAAREVAGPFVAGTIAVRRGTHRF
jgi:hypothetical protein